MCGGRSLPYRRFESVLRVVAEFSSIKKGELRLGPSCIRNPLAPPRTRSLGVRGWVRVSARGEARGKPTTKIVSGRKPKIGLGRFADATLREAVLFGRPQDASYDTPALQ